jgi:hypothetical protein
MGLLWSGITEGMDHNKPVRFWSMHGFCMNIAHVDGASKAVHVLAMSFSVFTHADRAEPLRESLIDL